MPPSCISLSPPSPPPLPLYLAPPLLMRLHIYSLVQTLACNTPHVHQVQESAEEKAGRLAQLEAERLILLQTVHFYAHK